MASVSPTLMAWLEPTAVWGLVGSLLGAAVGAAGTFYATRWSINKAEENQFKAAEQARKQKLKGLKFTLGLAVTENNITIAVRALREFLLNNPDLLEQSNSLQTFYALWLVEIDELISPGPYYWRSMPANESREFKMKEHLRL